MLTEQTFGIGTYADSWGELELSHHKIIISSLRNGARVVCARKAGRLFSVSKSRGDYKLNTNCQKRAFKQISFSWTAVSPAGTFFAELIVCFPDNDGVSRFGQYNCTRMPMLIYFVAIWKPQPILRFRWHNNTLPSWSCCLHSARLGLPSLLPDWTYHIFFEPWYPSNDVSDLHEAC